MKFFLRKIRWMVLFSILVNFSSCGNYAPPPLPPKFEMKGIVLQGKETIQFAVAQEYPGGLLFTFSGNLVGNFMVCVRNDELELSYGSLKETFLLQQLPNSGMVFLLSQTFLQLARPKQESVRRTHDGWKVSGTVDGVKFLAKIDKINGLKGLEYPNRGIKVKFF